MATLRQDFLTIASVLDNVSPGQVRDEVTLDNFRDMLLVARDQAPKDRDVLRLLLSHTITADKFIDGSKVGGVVLRNTEFPLSSRRVCQIQGRNSPPGTGFLVGPDLVLTASHVLRPGGTWLDPATVSVTFDVLVWSDKKVATRLDCVLAGVDYPVAFSLAPEDDAVPPQENELDYALVRITPAVGSASLPRQTGGTRGWFDGSVNPGVPALSEKVTILQHPNGKLLKVAQGAVLRLDVNSTRLRYGTSTETGSSGGPVLNQNQQLVGLHVLSDRVVNDTLVANEGVAFAAIFNDLAQKNITLPPP